MIEQDFRALSLPSEELTENILGVPPAIRVATLEKRVMEQLDHAHAIGDRAAALKAARMLDRIYKEVHAVLDLIEAAP